MFQGNKERYRFTVSESGYSEFEWAVRHPCSQDIDRKRIQNAIDGGS